MTKFRVKVLAVIQVGTLIENKRNLKNFHDKVFCPEQSLKCNFFFKLRRLTAQSQITSQLRNYCLSNEQFCFLTDVNSTRQIRLRTQVQKVSERTSHRAKNGRFHQKILSQFVSFNILLKCHSAICSGPFCLCSGEVNIKKGEAGEKAGGKSHHCPRRRSGRDQKWHFPLAATRSRCSGHRYQLQW